MSGPLLEGFVVILGILLLMLEAFGRERDKHALGYLAAGGLAFILILSLWTKAPPASDGYLLDGFARFYKTLALVCTIAVILLAIDYRPVLARFTDTGDGEDHTGEFHALSVFACAGMMWMASADNLISAFVALELVTITFYVLVAYLRRKSGALEAGVKYLILGALSTGLLVFGIAWIYGATGTLNFARLGEIVASGAAPQIPLLFGAALILIGIGFKIGAVPMHIWIPDVYQGTATPVTAFLAVGSKAAGFLLLLRVLTPLLAAAGPVRDKLLFVLLLIAGATLLLGNLAAIPQSNFKRLLAYSSIGHAGFLLLAVAAWKAGAPGSTTLSSAEVVSFYLGAYLLMTLGAFFVLAVVSMARGSESIAAFDGLAKRNPALAGALTVLMAALAGVPLTAGFFGKFFVFRIAVENGLWWGVGIAAIAAAAGFYYYFKVVRAMYWNQPSDTEPIVVPKISGIVIGTCVVAVIVLGFYPQPLFWLM
jgi:NADH-quinone oxidoreductase subunit N